MTRLGFALVALVGCGAKPAEPLAVPTPIAPNELTLPRPPHARPIHSVGASEPAPPPSNDEPSAIFPRPAIETPIDPPDIAELGRWPLTVAEHPALEPHFDIAGALADPGVTWADLCARGAQNRHLSANQELVAYLDAWCSVISADYSAAIVKLGLVRHAPNRRIVGALKLDVAAIAAAHGPAQDLESFLRAGGFLDVEEVDLISAAYFEVGKLADAAEANTLAEGMDAAPTEKMRCMRMLRMVADTADGERDGAIQHLRLAAHPPPDGLRTAHCLAQYDELVCWKERDCNGYWGDLVDGVRPVAVQNLGHVYTRWNRLVFGVDWYDAANTLVSAAPFRDRYTLMLPALSIALRKGCSTKILGDIDDVAKRAIEDLAPPRATGQMTRKEREAEVERTALLAALTQDEIKRYRSRLEATRATAQRLDKLDMSECQKAQDALPPVPP
jgi:hypothetical protein